jgi:hypothetical protein
MKKYKVRFSLFNLFQKSQAEVVQLQTIWMVFSGIITGATVISASPEHALYAALGCAAIDKALACFYFEERK